MALKATICKASLQIADIHRNYYAGHALAIARHPSETDERMMVRLLAFALNAHEHLAFGKGLSEMDEPDLWQKDLTGVIEHWIEVGQPDGKRLLRAAGRAGRVTGIARSCGGRLSPKPSTPKPSSGRRTWPCGASRCRRRRRWRNSRAAAWTVQCTVQDEQLYFSSAAQTVQIELETLKQSAF